MCPAYGRSEDFWRDVLLPGSAARRRPTSGAPGQVWEYMGESTSLPTPANFSDAAQKVRRGAPRGGCLSRVSPCCGATRVP